MLDHTRRGFFEEIFLIIAASLAFWILASYNDIVTHSPHVISDVAVFPAILFLVVYVVRSIRLSIVYRAYVWLKLLILPVFMFLMLSARAFFEYMDFWSSVVFFLMLALSAVYALVMKFHDNFEVFSINAPPERYAVLRAVMTKKERITLIIPERYLKYLETGDKAYLGVNVKGE